MSKFGADKFRNEVLFLARVLIVALFVIFGWSKLNNFVATVSFFTQDGVPLPTIATMVAIVMEFFVGLALLLGILTRPLAILLAAYTLATAFMGHPYWSMTGAAQMANEINFFKNISIIGGLLSLYVAGPGRYSADAIILSGGA
jgi:putative oxidoreductase